jgi:hypothetical protein
MQKERAPSVAGGVFLVTQFAYRVRPRDDPPKLVVVVLTRIYQI